VTPEVYVPLKLTRGIRLDMANSVETGVKLLFNLRETPFNLRKEWWGLRTAISPPVWRNCRVQ